MGRMGTTTERASGDSFDEVFGTAISKAVRAAVDTVGRDPLAELRGGGGDPHETDFAEPDNAADDGPVPLPTGRIDGIDPYALLGVTRAVSWEQITAAYRRRARAWHPDGADPAEAERRQDLIRQLNAAYTELRIRRGR